MAGLCDGIEVTGVCLMTEPPVLDDIIAREREVIMKTTADAVVSLLSNVAVPRLPKSVWLELPNAAPISSPLPL